MKYQTAPNSKTAPKRGLMLMEEFTITLRRHLHIFSLFLSHSTVGLLSCNNIERGASVLAKSRGSQI